MVAPQPFKHFLCSSDHFNGTLFANVAFNEKFFVYSREGEMWEISTVAWIMEMTIIYKNYANIFFVSMFVN